MKTVTFSKEGTFLSPQKNIGKIKLNRPDAMNSFSPDLLDDLNIALDQAEEDPEVRAVIITGEGKAFSAGADLKAMSKLDDVGAFAEKGQSVFRRIETFPKVIICSINGICIGGGMELALACDIRVAASEVKLGTPEVSLGLIPAWGGTQRLPYLIGMAKARELIFTGSLISSEEAEAIGLVSKVVPADELDSTAAFIASKVASNAPIAVREAKRSLNASRNLDIVEGNKLELEIAKTLSGTSDLREGIKAILEKRKPNFQGK